MSAPPDLTGTFAARACRAQLAWAVAAGVAWIVTLFQLPVDPDYTSGELLDHVMAWIGGDSLYPDPAVAPHRVLNYPPTMFAVARLLVAMGLDPFGAGRVLGSAGLIAALAVCYGWLREREFPAVTAAGVTALAAASFPLMYAAGQFHIEGFALAATLLGLRLASRDTMPAHAGAGLMLALACLIKQTQVVPSLIALAWVVAHRRHRAPASVGAFAATGALGSLAITLAFGPMAWRHMLTFTVGTYSLANLAGQTVQHAVPWIPIAAGALVSIRRHDRRLQRLESWFFVGATVWLLAAARVGSGFQYFLDWQAVALLCATPTLIRWLQAPGPSRLALTVWVAAANVVVAGILAINVRAAYRTRDALFDLCPLVARAPALTLGESAGAIRACGGRPAAHAFIVANLSRRGLFDEAPLIRAVTTGAYPRLLMPFDASQPAAGIHLERWSPSVLAAFRQSFVAEARSGGWWVLRHDAERLIDRPR